MIDFSEIKNGLINFIYSSVKSLNNNNDLSKAKHITISLLLEESLKLAKTPEGNLDLFALKPLLKANKYIYEQRIKELNKLESSEVINKQIIQYQDLICNLNKLINNIKQ